MLIVMKVLKVRISNKKDDYDQLHAPNGVFSSQYTTWK